MDHLSRGRTSQLHSLHTRKRQIAHARHTLRRALHTHRQRLLTLSSMRAPARYTAAVQRLRATLHSEYRLARALHTRAIRRWEAEVGELLVFLCGPGHARVGWVWAREEPDEEGEGVGEGGWEYVPPLVEEEEEEDEEEDEGAEVEEEEVDIW